MSSSAEKETHHLLQPKEKAPKMERLDNVFGKLMKVDDKLLPDHPNVGTKSLNEHHGHKVKNKQGRDEDLSESKA